MENLLKPYKETKGKRTHFFDQNSVFELIKQTICIAENEQMLWALKKKMAIITIKTVIEYSGH